MNDLKSYLDSSPLTKPGAPPEGGHYVWEDYNHTKKVGYWSRDSSSNPEWVIRHAPLRLWTPDLLVAGTEASVIALAEQVARLRADLECSDGLYASIKHLLGQEAGDGKLPHDAICALLAERDALRAVVEKLRYQYDRNDPAILAALQEAKDAVSAAGVEREALRARVAELEADVKRAKNACNCDVCLGDPDHD